MTILRLTINWTNFFFFGKGQEKYIKEGIRHA